MPTPSLSVDEIVATLQRSLAVNLVVEGTDDITVLRWIESRIDRDDVLLLPCGGRQKLLDVYRRRSEFASSRTVFIADRDLWLFSSVPTEYDGIIWTSGYSIENDLLAAGAVERLLDQEEKLKFREALKPLAEWFAYEVEEFLAGRPALVDRHPDEIVEPGTNLISTRATRGREWREPDRELRRRISRGYRLHLRGKCLLALLVRFLSAPKRHTRHNSRSLSEFACKAPLRNTYIQHLVDRVREQIDRAA